MKKTTKETYSEVADLLIDKVRQDLVDAVQAALTIHEKLTPEHDKYEPFLEGLVPSTDGFKVDQQKLRDFHNVLYFILTTTFGVDGSDGKSQANVQAHLTDRERYPSQWSVDIPYTHSIPDNDDLAWAEVLRMAALKASGAQEELNSVTRIIETNMRARGAALARRRRSEGCPDCKMGLVKAEWQVRYDFKRNCTEFQRRHLSDEQCLPSGRVLCDTCQTKEREEEVQKAS